LNIPHGTPYFVGELSREEAEEFFEKIFSNTVRTISIDSWSLPETMKVIVANQEYILEDDFAEKICHDKVYSLIEYNFLHLRPTSAFCYDIINPPNEAILTPMNQKSVNAMEGLFKKYVTRGLA
ncbi:5069_t:CDS:2, partial [Ambispora leptoticha]